MSTQGYPYPLAGRTALVTGGSRGIGEAIVMELARRGASTVLFTYVSPGSESRAEDICRAVRALPHEPAARAFRVDLSREDGPRTLVADILAARGDIEGEGKDGGEKGEAREWFELDILVNNAGAERVKPLGEISVDDYNAVYDLNVRGVILLTQALLPYIPARPSSRVLNIGSVGARAGFAAVGLYCSSKAALEALTRCWAAELGPRGGVTVNCVSPGPVQSALLDNIPRSIVDAQKAATPLGRRLGEAREVADVVAALAGPDGGWVTGQVISVSGGWAMY
ncbi:3-ketoacyl-acyl carrier protein reductase [Biscogniauxia marginata]|nr:3-ketoacyl-acyl carrier protein reductase [Biscogniauxia marginata]